MAKSTKRSAGLLMFRRRNGTLEVFLVHPGGPLWTSKDQGAWTLPKGQYDDSEEPLAAAMREFQEETGFIAAGPFLELGTIRQKSGKLVTAWAFKGDCDPALLVSNLCTIEWPPRTGRRIEVPEIDRGWWFTVADARPFLRAEQLPLLDRLESVLALQQSE